MKQANNSQRPSEPLHVLITGGASGLGLAMAREFHRGGHRVTACGRSAERLRAAQAELEGLRVVRADLTRAEDRAELMTQAQAMGGPVDVLVNNAALCVVHRAAGGSTAAEAEIATNLLAPIDLAEKVIGARQGLVTIANVSTGGALIPLTLTPLYSATKAGLHSFTVSLRARVRPDDVRVIEIFPPLMNTGLIEHLEVAGSESQGPEVVRAFAERAVRGVLRGDAVVADRSFLAVSLLSRFAPTFARFVANRAMQPREPAAS